MVDPEKVSQKIRELLTIDVPHKAKVELQLSNGQRGYFPLVSNTKYEQA